MSLQEQLAKFDKSKLQGTVTVERHLFQGDSKEPAKKGRSVLILAKYINGFHDWIHKDATKVLFTTKKVAEKLPFAAQKAYTEILTFEEYETSGLIEWRAFQLHKKYNFTHVVSLSEEDVIRAARIRSTLGISYGQNLESAFRYRDKVVMKELLQEKGVSVPTFSKVESASDVIRFVHEHGFPVVVKPRKGYSSVGTKILKEDGDLESFLSQGFGELVDPPLDLEVEKFIEGKMYHIDGLVLEGEARVIWPSMYTNTVAEFSNNQFLAAFSLQPDNPLTKRMQDFVHRVLQVLGGPPCFSFHAEVWHTPKDELVLCEIASRTGGGEIGLEFMELFGINLDKTSTQVQCEDAITNETVEKVSWQERRPEVPYSVAWIWMYPQVGTLSKFPDKCELDHVIYYTPYAPEGTVYSNMKSCADAVCSFLVKGTGEDEVKQNIFSTVKWYQDNTQWTN